MTDDANKPLEEHALEWQEAYDEAPKRDADFETLSGIPLKPLYTPVDDEDRNYDDAIGFPGEYPYTRGVYTSGHRGRLWTMRQFAGFGSAADTNERYHFLMSQGQTGLSVAFDMPALMGRDADDPLSLGEVGRCGASVSSLRDMEALFKGIPLGEISVSMTISGPAATFFCYYLAVAEQQGVPFDKLDGTCQTDILKEYIAQKEWVYPPRPHLRLMGDMMEFCAEHMPKYHPISVSGYHIREAGSTAAQELAFTLADGFAYVELGLQRGLDVDVFGPQLSFFFNSHIDFFEEIAKFRAARRIWARWMKERYGAKNPKAMQCRFHVQTAGCSLTLQQPYNNVVRTALEALAGVIGGAQSLHTNSLDEVYALPSEESVEIALRTQQIIAHETGVANVIDPLGGSLLPRVAHRPHRGGGRGLLQADREARRGLDARGVRPRRGRRLLPDGDRRGGVPAAEAVRRGAPGDRRRERVHGDGAGRSGVPAHRPGGRGPRRRRAEAAAGRAGRRDRDERRSEH